MVLVFTRHVVISTNIYYSRRITKSGLTVYLGIVLIFLHVYPLRAISTHSDDTPFCK